MCPSRKNISEIISNYNMILFRKLTSMNSGDHMLYFQKSSESCQSVSVNLKQFIGYNLWHSVMVHRAQHMTIDYIEFILWSIRAVKTGSARPGPPGQITKSGRPGPTPFFIGYIYTSPARPKICRAGPDRARYFYKEKITKYHERGKNWAQSGPPSRAILARHFLGLYLLSPARPKRRANQTGSSSRANFDSTTVNHVCMV